MKKYDTTKITSASDGNKPFWMPWGFGKWMGKALLFALLLCLFLLLFLIPECGHRQRGFILGPDSTYVTPGGDTLKGKNPRLFNPNNPRNGNPRNDNPSTPGSDTLRGKNPGLINPENPRNGNPQEGRPNPRNGGTRPVDWPPQLGDGKRNPGLPSPDDNRIPRTDPGDIVTDPGTGRQTDAAHLLVVLNSDAEDETYNRFAEELSALYTQTECSIVYYNTLTKLIVLEVTPQSRNNILNNLTSQINDIDFYVCDVSIFSNRSYHPNDPAFNYSKYSWHYGPIQAYDAWDITKGNKNVKVAVVDSYFELDHYDLRNVNVIDPVSLETGTTDVYPPRDAETGVRIHGTHVAGIIFAGMNNGEGACGIAPGCSFIPVSLGQSMSTISLVEGILYAVYKGADVVNVSIGIAIPDEIARSLSVPEQAEIANTANIESEHLWDYIFKLCKERNTTIVWAAGNSNVLSAIDETKRNSTTIIVDAVDRKLRKAKFSNFGNLPEYGFSNSTISAPGCAIMSTIPYCDYYPLDGTSMAAPIVTGAVALMKSICPTLTNEEVIDILKNTAKPVSDRNIGNLLQIHSALERIRSEFMRFDDILNDHSKILGRWESTELLYVTKNDIHTGEKVKMIMTFSEETAGQLEMEYCVGERTGEVCTTPITVTYSRDRITIIESHAPRSENGSEFVKSVYVCTPDRQGLLQALNQSENGKTFTFYLRKKE